MKENGRSCRIWKFEITERKAREGINPLTKEKIQIEASKSVKFKIARALKEAVNK